VSDETNAAWPTVSVIVPVRNEALHLRDAVAAIVAQEYPRAFDVCLAVGPSTDGTETIAAEIAAADPRVRVVDNPRGITPAALNAAITATTGEIVVRVDGHAELSPGYIERAVRTLDRTGAVNVGGVQRAEGTTPFERAVARAMTSPLGVGAARFHTGGEEGPVDTVYLGVFRRDALEAAGMFDEDLIRNQDYELNIRLRAAGGVVWFDPDLWVSYRPRPTVRRLARQYFEYGTWKRRVVRMHPRSLKPRQALPPLATLAIALGLITGPFWPPAFVVPAVYAAAIVVGSAVTGGSVGAAVRLVLVYPTMHLCWGAGFLLGRTR
jgi:glycosyltransferase involved in cell wall biosynthesis